MERKRSNTGLIVTIVVLVMIILFGGTLFVLSSMGYVSFEKNTNDTQNSVDYSKFVGTYVSLENKTVSEIRSSGGVILNIYSISDKGISFDVESISSNQRIAKAEVSDIEVVGVEDNLYNFKFNNDGFNNSGNGSINIEDGQILLSLSTTDISDDNTTGWSLGNFNNQKMNMVSGSSNENNEQKYGYIIEDYRKYANDFNYTSENINFIDTNIASEDDFVIGYVYYDLDSNGIDELLISRIDSNGKYLSIIDVYTLNDNNVIKILDESGVCQRCGIDIWNNGLLFYKGSGGADHGYLSFYNVSAIEKQVVDRYMYELDQNLNFSVYQINEVGTKISDRLSYSSEEQLVSYYKKNASNLSFDGVVFNKIK